MRKLVAAFPVLVALISVALVGAVPAPAPAKPYVPQPVYCYATPPTGGASSLCPVLPGDIGPDPSLAAKGLGYRGIINPLPITSAKADVQTPFDNLSWQTFVALNWRAGKQGGSAQDGLAADGPRVWQGWDRVSQVFGNSLVQANCHPKLGEQVFSIASNGNGTPAVRNEEYIQAATGDPAIDVDGNWTLYERRVNGIEIAYLRAPGGHAEWNLTTAKGQGAFDAVKGNLIAFPAKDAAPGSTTPNGAMEVKAAWRILDPSKHAANAKSYYIIRVMLAVAPDLVAHPGKKTASPICAHVELGLVAMHIIQKNPLTTNTLLPEWFWSTFEHVDNAPLADKACNVAQPGNCQETLNQQECPVTNPGASPYAYYNPKASDLATNRPPSLLPGGTAFLWNSAPPYARDYLVKSKSGVMAGTQITRCWQIYYLTRSLNAQWQAKLRAAHSVFANYMLVGTQWGAAVEPGRGPEGPHDALPNYLSNTTLETYLQLYYTPGNGFNTGSCISCHSGANLTTNQAVLSNFSFLPGLVNPVLTQTRRAPLPPTGAKK